MKRFLLFACFAAVSLFAAATDIRVKVGYNIGGVTPLSMPQEIRKLNSYHPGYGFTAGVEALFPINQHWGVSLGLQLRNLYMRTDATVKNYHTRITMDSETIEGYFTGNVKTRANLWYMAIPLQATYRLSPKWQLYAGPYLALCADAYFDGHVYQGYLRKDTPTGDRVNIGNDRSASYNFSNDIASINLGFSLGADYQFSSKWGVFTTLQWGLTDAFTKDFTAISFLMFPIQGTVGMSYLF